MSATPPRKPAQASPAGAAARRRPAFPASLEGLSAAPSRASGFLRAAPALPPDGGIDSSAGRCAMVARLEERGIGHPVVLRALASVERHRFVDPALVYQAYEDTSLPIGLGQTISKPSVIARMLSLLLEGRTRPLGRVLEIGTGCGYQAAVIGQFAREVYSIERLRGLHEKARENLRPLRLANLRLILGDGMLGYPQGAGYDAIVSAAGGESLPEAWVDQLAPGGRLVAPVAAGPGQQLLVVDKTERGCVTTLLESVHFVPLKSGIA